jgi:hypothetical protein
MISPSGPSMHVLSLLDPAVRRSLATVAQSENDWYANLLWFDRRKCLLVTHSRTLFSVVAANVRSADIRTIDRFVVGLIEGALIEEELPVHTFGQHAQEPVVFAKTADRSVLGCMNDMAFLCEAMVRDAGSLRQCDLVAMNRQLRRNISHARGYVPPIELAARLVGQSG